MRKMKKMAALILALVLCIGSCLSLPADAASASSFSDLKSTAWYYDSVSYVLSNGLYQGMSATVFGPSESMTRAMFVTVLGRMAGVDRDSWCLASISGSGVNFRSGPGTSYGTLGSFSKGDTVTITGRSGDWYAVRSGSKNGYVKSNYVSPKYKNFSDVSYGQYYTGYIIWAYENGYVNGIDSTHFDPNGCVTREQICRILHKYAEGKGYSISASQSAISFTDASSIHSWASDAVKAMQQGGIVSGYEDGSFLPRNNATRAEVAKIIRLFVSATGLTIGQGGSGTSGGTASTGAGSTGGSSSGSSSGSGSSSSSTSSGTTSSAAGLSSDTVSVGSQRMRVALYASTKKDFDDQVDSVTLTNLSGNGFEYGTMSSDRSFAKEGSLSSATIVITTNGTDYTVTDGSGNTLTTRTGSSLAIHPVGDHPLTSVSGLYNYHGDFNCLNSYRDDEAITLVNYVDMEDYVKGVLPYEFGTWWPSETFKAGAIAVRSYAMAYAKSSAYSSFGFDLVNSSGCQVYSGRKSTDTSKYSTTDAAVDATANMYLTYNGAVCYCMYGSSNGGATKAGNYAYLTAKSDPYDAESTEGYGGHGIGMSQWGAYIMAKNHDLNYLDILGFYYTGTTVKYGA